MQPTLKHSVPKMKILIYLVFLGMAGIQAVDKKCDGVPINGVMHIKEVLKTNLDSPYQFSIDYTKNTLFFSHTIHTKDERFQLAYINLENKEFKIVPGIKDGFATAVDHAHNKIYLSAKGGIYDFNLKTNQANLLGSSSQNIWQMFYKDGLYFTTYPTEEAHLFKDGTSTRLTELAGTRAMLIALDGNKNIYFTNSSGLFKYNKFNKEVMNLGDYVINGLNSDVNGKLYFTSPNGIFLINGERNTVQRLATLDNVYAAAVEKDGSIVCAIEDSIVRFKRHDKCNV